MRLFRIINGDKLSTIPILKELRKRVGNFKLFRGLESQLTGRDRGYDKQNNGRHTGRYLHGVSSRRTYSIILVDR